MADSRLWILDDRISAGLKSFRFTILIILLAVLFVSFIAGKLHDHEFWLCNHPVSIHTLIHDDSALVVFSWKQGKFFLLKGSQRIQNCFYLWAWCSKTEFWKHAAQLRMSRVCNKRTDSYSSHMFFSCVTLTTILNSVIRVVGSPMFGDPSYQNEHLTIFLSIPKQKSDVLEMFSIFSIFSLLSVGNSTLKMAPGK